MIEFSCQACSKVLKTADDKAGMHARCPGCGAEVVVPEPGRKEEPVLDAFGGDSFGGTSRDADAEWDEDDDRASRKKTCPMCGEQVPAAASTCKYCGERLSTGRKNRRVQAPHRGGMILAFGIMSWAVCPIFGLLAFILGSSDLKEMDAGRMDTEGRGLTQAGRLIGIIHFGIALVAIGGMCLLGIIGAALDVH